MSHPILNRARDFRAQVGARRAEFAALADGQSPEILFISCSDSRVVPSMIMGTRPGELFELRNAGNVVTPYNPDQPHAECATIEYALKVLDVGHIVICGHSHCGAVQAMRSGVPLRHMPAVQQWLDATESAADICSAPEDPALAGAVQAHLRTQYRRLLAYDEVASRVEEGVLTVHCWFYEVHTGTVSTLRDDRFVEL